MFLMLQSIGIALGIVQATAPVAGASIAAGIAAEIVKSCEEVSQQKVCRPVLFLFCSGPDIPLIYFRRAERNYSAKRVYN